MVLGEENAEEPTWTRRGFGALDSWCPHGTVRRLGNGFESLLSHEAVSWRESGTASQDLTGAGRGG